MPTPKLSFLQSHDLVIEAARDNLYDEMPQLVVQHGRAFSMIEHAGLDSFDAIEMMQTVEEKLQAIPGLEDFLMDETTMEAQTLEELYEGVCRQAGITPDYSAATLA